MLKASTKFRVIFPSYCAQCLLTPRRVLGDGGGVRDDAVRRGEGAGVRHVAPRGHDLLVRVHLRRHVCRGAHVRHVASGH